MARKTKLVAGDHRGGATFRKEKDTLRWTSFCRCGWKGDETPNQTAALEQFDEHMKRIKRGEPE